MPQNRVKFSNIVQNQLPAYVQDEFPLVAEFLKSYYEGQEYQSGPIDLIENIDQYIKVSELTNTTDSIILGTALDLGGDTVNVDLIESPNGTKGFPESYGLLKIDDEIITYTGKTDSSFTGCVRGFSGVTSYTAEATSDTLVFETTKIATHVSGSTITNLSDLFLKEFLLKVKRQLIPGLDDRTFDSDLDQNVFIKHAKDFYLSKGSDKSFEILFKALYNEDVKIVRPKDFLFTPSNAQWRVTNDLVVEPISGNPENLENSTLFQQSYADSINKAYAPITAVEPLQVGFGQTFYKLSIDAGYNRDIRVDGAIYGSFEVQPTTRVIGAVSAGTTVLNVDSTVGFAATGGDLYIPYADGTTGIVSYRSKSLTQFFGVGLGNTGVLVDINDGTTIGINTFAYGQSNLDQDETVTVRINSVLNKFNFSDKTFYYSEGDTIKLKTLGVSETGFKAKSWFYNISPTYNIKSIELIDASDKTYKLTLGVDHSFRFGDSAVIIASDKSQKNTNIINIESDKSIVVRGQGNIDLTDSYTIKRDILTAQSNTFPKTNLYVTNVQNVYSKPVDILNGKPYNGPSHFHPNTGKKMVGAAHTSKPHATLTTLPGVNKLLVSSSSLPTYNSQPLNVYSQTVKFSGSFVGSEFNIKPVGDHGFYTGDAVYYKPEKENYEFFDSLGNKKVGVKVNSSLFSGDVGFIVTGLADGQTVEDRIPPNEGLYFVTRVDANIIKLSKSRTNIFNSIFISIDNSINASNCEFKPYDFRFKTLESQKIVREISEVDDDGKVTPTEPGFTGMLINGVEICNYKSKEFVYYGKINQIDVNARGSNYDVINPPLLSINDNVGTGATGFVAVSGNLKEIRLLDSGFDYQDTPIISINGGNGKGAVATANMKKAVHSVSFNSQSDVGLGTTAFNSYEIGFGTFHKFTDFEEVIYKNAGQKNVGGLSTDSSYFVSKVGLTTVKLFQTQNDAISGINTVELTSFGIGKQFINSANRKTIVDSINVIDSGSGYQNKKRTVLSSTGINTALNQIKINDHDYQSGDIINYVETSSTVIGGLSADREYYVTAINADEFKLSEVGIGSTAKDFYYNTKQYIDFTSAGVGTQTFNYPDITVSVVGTVGIASTGTETFECKVQPIFRGEVTSIHLSNQGVGYGSSEIINFLREPQVTLIGGTEAQLKPVIVNGSITEIVVMSKGQKYNAAPTLTINGDGIGAVITPVFENNEITEVKVIHGGNGYTSASTSISVDFPGAGVNVKPILQHWRVNLFERNLANVSGDDGYIAHEFRPGYGLQYSHLYAPRVLRESVFANSQEGNTLYGDKDLQIVNGLEVPSNQHSPILGYAYDGHPIYGPYGYVTQSGGVITQMKSGYSLTLAENRPSTLLFPEGFFVEDFTHKNVADETILDENNGRFCVTPEFPDGTYAYFTTIDSGATESSGPFQGYKKPVFPYLIGENYRSIPNEFNFKNDSNQDAYDLQNFEWQRNTEPYNLIEGDTEYDYVYIPNKLSQIIDIKSVTPGSVENIGIETGGILYQIGDSAIFDNSNTSGTGAVAKVSVIDGKTVDSISFATSSITGVEIYADTIQGDYLLVSDNPHNFKNKDIITVSGLSTTSSQIEGSYTSGITTSRFVVTGVGTDSTGIGTDGVTGLVTHINVLGNLTYPNIDSNDILGIGTERVKVLNVEKNRSRIRVLRAVDGTVAAAHTVTSFFFQDQRRLTINAGFNTTLSSNRNREIYFNPSETVGLGTTAGVGIGSTLYFSNPGAGISEIFIQTKALFIPGHDLSTGDELTYSPNGGSGIVVLEEGASYPSGISTLTNGDTLFVAKISDSLIGLSTVRVGLGTTGTFVGIASTHQSSSTLFFASDPVGAGIGTGVFHSFKTNYSPITAKINRNLVTVSAASSHGLINNDEVTVDVNPSISTSFIVKYNDFNRRVIVTPKSFISSGVNTSTNTFTLNDHDFVTGQKIIYTSDSPIEGLVDDGIYYVVKIDDNNFKLSDSHYNSTLSKPIIIGITSASAGVINPINPSVDVYKDSTVSFDLSDSSLSYTVQGTQYPAFELNFYTDRNYTNKWENDSESTGFNVTRTGSVGITADAKITLEVTKTIPEILYYRLDPVFESNIPDVKKEVVVDEETVSNNEVISNASVYNGKQTITTASTTAFTYTIADTPEQVSYAGTTSDIDYTTTSTNAYGSISRFEIKNSGVNYYSLPGITTITSTVGSGAVAEPSSSSIGKIKTTKIEDIGYTFPSDPTLKPSALLPQIIDIESLASFTNIGITSGGRGYGVAPKLLIRDGKTKKIITDADLRYSLGDTNVTILKNPTGMTKSYAPTLIPFENSNGVGISTVGFNTITKDAFVKLSVGFSTADSFPFVVGDTVMIENVSIGIGSTGKGFNSADHDFKFFTVNAVDANLGGIGATITYSMAAEFPDNGTFPGAFDPNNSAGRIIPEKYFPQFDIKLGTNDYLEGETVSSSSASGTVESWNSDIGLLKVSANNNFKVGDIIKGSTSDTQGIASSIKTFDSDLELEATSKVLKGWQDDSGFINSNIQRLQDSLYYQNFSYAIRSRVVEDTWNDVVSTLNHTLGFKKFSDYQLESTSPSMAVGVSTNQTSVDIVSDLVGVGDLNCVYDFDLVTENSRNTGSTFFSDEIIFSSRILTDFTESVGNRVLSIDDMSGSFNSNPRATKFSVVNTFVLNDSRALKFITLINDKRFTQERQLMLVSLLHDGSQGYINQYGRVETSYDQGSFDFSASGTDGQLLFFPTKATVNDYDVTTISYNLDDTLLGIGSTSLSDVAIINTSSTNVPSGTTTNVVGIASTYRSLRVLVEITPDLDDLSEFEYNEFTVLHDGTNVDLLEYGELITSQGSYSDPGFGTFHPYISGTDLKVDFIPNSSIGTTCVVNTIQVALASTSSGIGTIFMNHAKLDARATSISASGTPGFTTIAQYNNDFDAGYFFVQVTDTTNDRYQVSEVLVIDNHVSDPAAPISTFDTEYGVIESVGAGLGTIGSIVDSNGIVSLTFTPLASIAVDVAVFSNALKHVIAAKDSIDFTNATINSGFGEYFGTERDIKRAFNLTHDTNNIFERYVLCNDANIVSVSADTITIPNHFFVTGEQISYSHSGSGSTMAIGIASTSFAGIGTTDKVPSDVFVVKISSDAIKLARSAEDALKVVPEPLNITSVGIGTSHRFVATNQNAKALIALDNIIQSPVVSTAVTTTLSNMIRETDNVIEFSGINSFFGADLIKINNEIMKIEGVGIGSTNFIRVRREWLGTVLAGHGTGDKVTKVIGNYNIVNNLLTFSEAPYGNVPIGSTTNPPDERDWTGISTGSHFQGRTFMRSGETDGVNETYSENYVFDSISEQFDGIERTFRLKSDGVNVTGIQTDTVILVNDIFQGNGSVEQYTISETSGISSINFTGTATSVTSDPNGSNLPLGGIIVSVGSSEGFGYQPLVAAGGTAIIGNTGIVSAISVGNTGSGYRSGIQTTVNISIKEENLNGVTLTPVGIATIENGHVTGTAVTNTQVFYKPKSISDVGYTSTTGVTIVSVSTAHGLSVGDEVSLSGIAFTCDYAPPLGINTAAYNNVTGILTVTTNTPHGYNTSGKTSVVIFTGLAFTCQIDNGATIHTYPRSVSATDASRGDPFFGGASVISVNSTTEFEAQVGTSTVPTFYVGLGTVQGAIVAPRRVNNSPTKIDPAAASKSTVLQIIDNDTFLVNTGISTLAHFYARGGTVHKPFDVVFDDPLSYSNLPLQYASGNVGVGTGATIDIVVGQGSSVVNFTVQDTGYGYGNGQSLTVAIGGTTGIPTSTGYKEFLINVEETFSDEFTGWSLGILQSLDNFDSDFNGSTKAFQLTDNGDLISIRAGKGSEINVQDILLIFINDILQVPGKGYTFDGGSVVTFTEAPKVGDKSRVIFYKGSGDSDVINREIIETVKKGDDLTIESNSPQESYLQENERIVLSVNSTDIVSTNPYYGPGNTTDENLQRPVVWCRQTEDKIINEKPIGKDRELYEPQIAPYTYITKSVGIGSTAIYVDSLRPLFNTFNEREDSTDLGFQKKIKFHNQAVKTGAAGTAIVSIAGTISSVDITDGGVGYTTATVSFGSTTGIGTTTQAFGSVIIGAAGTVTGVAITSAGVGYTHTNVPSVLISPPTHVEEENTVSTYNGDQGIIVGFGTTTIASKDQMIFDLFIPEDSFLRLSGLTGTAITMSGIGTNDIFVVTGSHVGDATTSITSVDSGGNTIGVGKSFIDNVYSVASFEIVNTTSGINSEGVGIGTTHCARVFATITSDFSWGGTGIETSNSYGTYSWGRIDLSSRSGLNSYTAFTEGGVVGITTSTIIERSAPLKFKNYKRI